MTICHTSFPLRSESLRFVAVLCLLVSTRATASECLPPAVHDPEYRADGVVAVKWVHPAAWADTVRAHSRLYDHGFTVSDTYADIAVAWKLPSFTTTGMIGKIKAYFFGKAGTDTLAWSIHAAFAWSLRLDSLGMPGQLLHPEVQWPLGDSANLQWGGWYERPFEWWLPESTGAGLWLVGRWPDNAGTVLMLGADDSLCTLATLAGYTDGTGPQWVTLAHPGLLVEITVLAHGDTMQAVSPVPGWRIYREAVSGPMPADLDTVVLPALSSYTWYDSTAIVGQTLRYGVAAICDTGTGPAGWTLPMMISPHWPLLTHPESVDVQCAYQADTTVLVTLDNLGGESLSVTLSSAGLTALPPSRQSKISDGVILDPVPDSFDLAPDSSQIVAMAIHNASAIAGIYSGSLLWTVRGRTTGLAEHRSLPIRLTIDSPTGILDDRDTRPQRDPAWDITAVQNPFSDVISLRIPLVNIRPSATPNHAEAQGSPLPLSLQGLRQAHSGEIAIYNILGQCQKSQPLTLDASMLTGVNEITVQIDGTAGWPAGVYLCRVRVGDRTAIVKLVHIR